MGSIFRFSKKDHNFNDLFEIKQIQRKMGFSIGKIVMCAGCGGLFDFVCCEKKEVIRRPRRGNAWLDYDYYCKHCQGKKK